MFLTSIVLYVFLLLSAWLLLNGFRFIKFLCKLRKYGKAVDKFPMEPKHWLWGHMKMLSGPGEESLDFFTRMMTKYPKAFGMYLGNFIRPYVVVYDPEVIKLIVKVSGNKPNLLGMYGYGKYWVGDGLSVTFGEKWFRNRRLLTPVFNFEALRQYSTIFNQSADLLAIKLFDFVESGESFEVQEMLSHFTLDVVLKCVFSYNSGVLIDGKNCFYHKAVNEITRLWMKRYVEPWKHFDFIYWRTEDGKCFKKNADIVNMISEKLIRERKQLIEKDFESAQKYHDFLNILLMAKYEDGHGLTEQELRDEVTTFISAGYHTTSSSLSWVLYSLATNTDCQRRCQKEVDDLLQGRPDDNITWDILKNLNYITMCIRESLRLYGGPPFIERELGETMVIDGREVPSGSSIMLNLFCLHRNPNVWTDPLVYNPNRFSEENVLKMDPFACIPFAAGSRNCIGQNFALDEMKISLAKLLRRFTFTAKPNHVPIKVMSVMLKASNGIFLNVSERPHDK